MREDTIQLPGAHMARGPGARPEGLKPRRVPWFAITAAPRRDGGRDRHAHRPPNATRGETPRPCRAFSDPSCICDAGSTENTVVLGIHTPLPPIPPGTRRPPSAGFPVLFERALPMFWLPLVSPKQIRAGRVGGCGVETLGARSCPPWAPSTLGRAGADASRRRCKSPRCASSQNEVARSQEYEPL